MQETTSNSLENDPLEVAFQHRQCADIHERASRHFREAARLYERNDLAQGAIHSSIARKHAGAALQQDSLRTSNATQYAQSPR